MNTRQLKKHLKYKIPQIKLAIVREPMNEPLPAIRTPADLEQYLEPLRHLPDEHFVALHLNTRNEVQGFQVISHGTVSSSLVHPREVFKAALLSNAYCIVVAHNHPSGSTTPSQEDIQTTKQLVAAGHILGVNVIDHLIVSYRSVFSIRESRPELFEEQPK